jgi:hypothetical protein
MVRRTLLLFSHREEDEFFCCPTVLAWAGVSSVIIAVVVVHPLSTPMLAHDWSAGAVWRSTSSELVLVANGESGGPPTYRRQTVTREWTVHFVNGPFQEMYLSEAPLVQDGGPICREAAGCGTRDEVNKCARLQEELDSLGKLLRDGHYHNLIHLNGHDERQATDLCPCTCALPATSTDDAVEQHLDALVENVTALLRNDSAHVRRSPSARALPLVVWLGCGCDTVERVVGHDLFALLAGRLAESARLLSSMQLRCSPYLLHELIYVRVLCGVMLLSARDEMCECTRACVQSLVKRKRCP